MSFAPEKALTKTVVLLSGDESVLRSRALQALLKAAGAQPDDFDLEFTAGDVSDPTNWLGSASTSPFMGERRIVVVRHVTRREASEAKAKDFAALPKSALLILVADDEAGSEDKAQRLKSNRTKWEKLVKDAGGHVESFSVDPKQARDEIKRELAAAGKTMSEKALDTLVEMTGGSLSRAMDEVEKLVLFAGKQEQIREADVREVVVPSREWNVFKMVDAIFAGAVPEALRQLRILVGGSAKAEDAAIGRILPMVSRHLRLLWQARLCVDASCPPGNPPEHVRSLLPSKPNLVDEKPYRHSALTTAARKADLGRLQRCMAILADTDARLKGSLPAFNAMETLERMVLEMSQALR